MNKHDLVVALAEADGMAKAQAEKVLDFIISKITDSIVKGEKVTIAGFGVFSVTNRDARKGRNPATGESVDIPAKRVPKFKPGKELKNLVLSGKTDFVHGT